MPSSCESLDTTISLTPEALDTVEELAGVSLEFYEDELRRKTELEKLEFWKSTASTNYTVRQYHHSSDGSTTVHPHEGHRAVVEVVELKNGTGEGRSDSSL